QVMPWTGSQTVSTNIEPSSAHACELLPLHVPVPGAQNVQPSVVLHEVVQVWVSENSPPTQVCSTSPSHFISPALHDSLPREPGPQPTATMTMTQADSAALIGAQLSKLLREWKASSWGGAAFVTR